MIVNDWLAAPGAYLIFKIQGERLFGLGGYLKL